MLLHVMPLAHCVGWPSLEVPLDTEEPEKREAGLRGQAVDHLTRICGDRYVHVCSRIMSMKWSF